MNSDNRNQSKSGPDYNVAIVCLIVFIFTAGNAWELWQAKSWPTASAKVENSKTIDKSFTDEDGDTTYKYDLEVRYHYGVGEKHYVHSETVFSTDDLNAANQEAAKFAKGSVISVRYYPDNPDVCFLKVDQNNLYMFLAGAILSGFLTVFSCFKRLI